MPEWLLALCVNLCIFTGAIVSVLILAILFVIVGIEVYDFFHDDPEVDDEIDEARGYYL